MTKIIIFNGPKNSGKNALAEHLTNVFPNSGEFMFKNHLIQDVCDYYHVNQEWFELTYNDRVTKEVPMAIFGGLSPRQAIIHVSEEIIKPQYGLQYYGKCLVEDVKQSGVEIAFVSDGGVNNNGVWEELQPVADGFGDDNVTIVQIYRNGCNFDGDSRNYWGTPVWTLGRLFELEEETICQLYDNFEYSCNFGLETHAILNSGTIEEFYKNGVTLVEWITGCKASVS